MIMADPAKILIVEDERITAKALMELIKILNYMPLEPVASGEDAISKARALSPDLVLMDIILEGTMTGIDAAKVITEELDIPVIFITAYGDIETLSKAKLAEPLGYIVKPVIDEKDIRPAIELALYNHQIKSANKLKGKKYESIATILEEPGAQANSSHTMSKIKYVVNEASQDGVPMADREKEIDLAALANWMEALSNGDRFVVMSLIRNTKLTMTQIQSLLGKSQSTSSHHIKTLEDVGLIKAWKSGKFTQYAIDNDTVYKFLTNWSMWFKTIANWK
jgi:CheY-like chemotaxis protein